MENHFIRMPIFIPEKIILENCSWSWYWKGAMRIRFINCVKDISCICSEGFDKEKHDVDLRYSPRGIVFFDKLSQSYTRIKLIVL